MIWLKYAFAALEIWKFARIKYDGKLDTFIKNFCHEWDVNDDTTICLFDVIEILAFQISITKKKFFLIFFFNLKWFWIMNILLLQLVYIWRKRCLHRRISNECNLEENHLKTGKPSNFKKKIPLCNLRWNSEEYNLEETRKHL